MGARTLAIYRDGAPIPGLTFTGLPAEVYVGATPYNDNVTVRIEQKALPAQAAAAPRAAAASGMRWSTTAKGSGIELADGGAIARTTGKIRWLTQLPRWRNEEDKKGPIFWSGPVLAGGNLWAVNSEGHVYRISTGEGSASLFTDLDQPISLAPVVANNTLYILDDSGRITAFR